MTGTASAAPSADHMVEKLLRAIRKHQARDFNSDHPALEATAKEASAWLSAARAQTTQPAVVEPLTADDVKQPKSGQRWRVEWWNESCRMMLPKHLKLDRCQVFKNGTLMFTIKQAAHSIGIKGGHQ